MRAPTRAWRTTLLASMGAGLEYCDFVIYLLMAPYLARAFFPSSWGWAGPLQSAGLFTVGYIARPLGGLFLGSRGDRHGRRDTFVYTTALMAGATCGIGCLPTYAQLGVAAPMLLVALRCVQGFSMGGELPGAITFVSEHAPPGRCGRHVGAIIAGICTGGIVATTLLNGLTLQLDDATMQAWGWRLPFGVCGGLAFLLRMLRHRLLETPAFVGSAAGARPAAPLRRLMQAHRRAVLGGVGMAICGTSLVIFSMYAPLYVSRSFAYDLHSLYRAIALGMGWACVASIGAGFLADRFGARRLLVAAALAWACLVIPCFALLRGGTLLGLHMFFIIWQTFQAVVVGSYWVLLTQLFPTAVRYSGLGVCINSGFIFTSLLPILFDALIAHTGEPLSIAPVYALLALVGVASAGLARPPARAAVPAGAAYGPT